MKAVETTRCSQGMHAGVLLPPLHAETENVFPGF